MPHTFVPVGRHWLNLDLVASIELVEDTAKPGVVVVARVYYSNGLSKDFHDEQEIRALTAFLQKNRAT